MVVAGTREPQTEAAKKDDIIHEKVLQALDAAFNLYGIHYAVHGGSKGSAGQEASGAVTTAEYQVALPQGQLLPVQAHLRERHQRVDDSRCLDTEGYEQHWVVQGSNGLL